MFGKTTFGIIIIVAAIAYRYKLNTSNQERSPVIETALGKIQGVISNSRGGRVLYEYLGVPYATPPVDRLRFEPPQPVAPWEGVKDASFYGQECAQLMLLTGKYAGHEDCLYLNVFVPQERKGHLPVMVFLHGGAFVSGSSNNYRPSYFMDENVILVTINYRLAALGFLNTGDDVVKGNMGLKDQNMALRWVQQNIKSFGGDPKKVILFGESAGSASTSFHLVSPISKGLFSKAIMQSGTFTSDWAVYPEPVKQSRRFAEKFGCTNESSKEMVECLKNVDTRTFVDAHKEMLLPLRDQITLFVPTIETVKDDGAFLTENPMKALQTGKVHKVPILAGVNQDEGLLTSAVITGNQSKLDQANNEFNFWAGRLLYYNSQEKTDISAKIRQFYFGDTRNIATKDLVQNYTNLFSDRMFFGPLHKFAIEYREHAPLRLYIYTHKGQFSLARLLTSSQKPYFPVVVNVILDMTIRWIEENVLGWELTHPGVCHADELPLFYNWMLSPAINEASKDFEMSKILVKTWSDFAHNDKSLKCKSVEWETTDPKAKYLSYMKLDTNPRMIEEPFQHRLQFWESLGV